MPKYLSYTLLLSLLLCFHTECKAAFLVHSSHQDSHAAAGNRKTKLDIFARHYERRLFPHNRKADKFDWDDAARQSFISLMVDAGLIGIGFLLYLYANSFILLILGVMLIATGLGGLAFACLLAIIALIRRKTRQKGFAWATLAILAVAGMIYWVLSK